MIHKLVLRNFQRHTNLKIKLDPHVTTICGPSDRGKSAVLRALRWLVTNRPGGDAFVRDGEDATHVSVVVDGVKITRKKGKGVNTYSVDGHTFKAFGSEPPGDVVQILNMNDVNFQGQMDAPFWFSESAGEVSKKLNQIVNLEDIDSTLAHLNTRIRENTSRISVIEERLETAQKDRKSLERARTANEELCRIEQQDTECRALVQAAAGLDLLLSDLTKYSEQLKGAAQLEALGGILMERMTEYKAAYQDHKEFEDSVTTFETALQELCEAEQYEKELEREFNKAMPEVCPLCQRKK